MRVFASLCTVYLCVFAVLCIVSMCMLVQCVYCELACNDCTLHKEYDRAVAALCK